MSHPIRNIRSVLASVPQRRVGEEVKAALGSAPAGGLGRALGRFERSSFEPAPRLHGATDCGWNTGIVPPQMRVPVGTDPGYVPTLPSGGGARDPGYAQPPPARSGQARDPGFVIADRPDLSSILSGALGKLEPKADPSNGRTSCGWSVAPDDIGDRIRAALP